MKTIHGQRAISSPRSPTWYGAVVVLAVVIVWAAILGWRAQQAVTDRAAGLRLAAAGNGDEAEPRLVAAWDRDGTDVEVTAALARLKLASADPAAALTYLTRWCELRPDDPKPFQLRMDLRHRIARGRWAAADRLKDMDGAAGDGQHVLGLDPGNDAVRREVAWLSIQVGRFADADAACRTALAESPLDGWMTYLLARAVHGRGKRSEAERVLDPVIKAQPKFADGLLLRAKLHTESDRPAEAVPLLRRALALDTGSRRECLYQLGLALAATGERAEADKVMAEVNLLSLKSSVAADEAPQTEAMRVQIAEAMLGMGRLNEAKEQLDKVVAETPAFEPAHRVLAIYFDRTNQPDRAAEHRRLAAERTADDPRRVEDRPCRVLGLALVVGAVIASGRLRPVGSSGPPPDDGPEPGGPWFVDVTARPESTSPHFDPATEHHYIQETMGSGRRLDRLRQRRLARPVLRPGRAGPARRPATSYPTCKLYRNNRDGTFTDVTETGRPRPGRLRAGVAVGDFDNDGFDDLVITYLGGVALYHNNGNGTFTDVTGKAGLKNSHWASSCAWGDVDGDGLLDLYICNYVEVDIDHYPDCEKEGKRYVCPPTAFPHVSHRLYRNNGNGTFTDVTASAGIATAPPAPGLGVVTDGRGRRREARHLRRQRPQASSTCSTTGATAVRGERLVVRLRTRTVRPARVRHGRRGLRRGRQRAARRSSSPTFRTSRTSFIATAGTSGSTRRHADRPRPAEHRPARVRRRDDRRRLGRHARPGGRQRPHPPTRRRRLPGPLRPVGTTLPRRRRRQIPRRFGPRRRYFRQPKVGRGLAWADFDNDGKPDLVFNHVSGPPALLHNETQTPNRWLGLELIGDGERSNRNAVGSRVEIETATGRQVRFVNGGGSYLSASDRRVLAGLGPADHASVTVRWPSGKRQVYPDLKAGAYWRLTEGRATAESISFGK